jgi:hypothetical protein
MPSNNKIADKPVLAVSALDSLLSRFDALVDAARVIAGELDTATREARGDHHRHAELSVYTNSLRDFTHAVAGHRARHSHKSPF